MRLCLMLLLAGCSVAIDDDVDVDREGTLECYLSASKGEAPDDGDDPVPDEDVDTILLDLKRIEIRHDSEGWIEIVGDLQPIDLIDLSQDHPQFLAEVDVPEGTYDEVRLILDDAWVVLDGEQFDLTVPSGAQTGLKVKGEFCVEDGDLEPLQIDLSVTEAIRLNPQGYRLNPVIQLEEKPPCR